MAKSAFLPTSRLPIVEERPRARAPFMVASSRTVSAGTAVGFDVTTWFCLDCAVLCRAYERGSGEG